ncbi:MAG: sigma 54-interacting transcriptional regulator [Desulfobacterales bacterium]|nr:sigma 54-interacting transcriptional regulator [Desulfobacterales bacterium]
MQNKKIKIGVIISSNTIANNIKSMKLDPQYDMRMSVVGLEIAIDEGLSMEKRGVEVILSHTGTSNLLQENIQVPVISIHHSSLDLISAMMAASRLGHKILIPTFREKIQNFNMISKLFQKDVKEGIYHDSISLEKLIYQSSLNGSEVVVGGGLGVFYAKKYGLKGVEIEVSADTIKTSFANAVSVVRANRLEKERMRRLYSIIDSVSEGIISVDQNGIIMTVNRNAMQILNISKKNITNTPYQEHLPWGLYDQVLKTQEPINDRIERINDQLYIINYSPVFLDNKVLGCISTLHHSSRLMQSEQEVRRSLAKGMVTKYTIDDLIWSSSKMGNVIDTIKKFSHTDCTVLVTGETGTGKEIVAQGIHALSTRRTKPFVSINCAALPEHLLESELFGYEGGAFTGSKKSGKPGLFEMAHEGTILLDEISATSLKVQALMLRVLQEREVMRIGGDRLIPVNVRVIANANKELCDEIINGTFREDLYFRLNVLQINIPGLRKRPEDIPILAKNFISKFSWKYKLTPIHIPGPFMEKLMNHSWPGNVRQLINFTEQMVLMSQGHFNPDIFETLYYHLIKYSPNIEKSIKKESINISKDYSSDVDQDKNNFSCEIREKTLEHEAYLISAALERSKHNKTSAAAYLGMSRTTLYNKMRKLNLA